MLRKVDLAIPEQDEGFSSQIRQVRVSFPVETPQGSLISSIYSGDMEAVKQAIETDPSCAMERSSCGAYPIHLACLLGQLAIVEFGLSIAANCALCETDDGILPLHVAAYGGYHDICEALVRADKFTTTKQTKTGHRPEDAARMCEHTALAEWLQSKRTECELAYQASDLTTDTIVAVGRQQRPDLKEKCGSLVNDQVSVGNANENNVIEAVKSNANKHIRHTEENDTSVANESSSAEQTQNYLIAEFQRASLLEEEADHHSLTNGQIVGLSESMMLDVSEDLVGSVTPGEYNQLGQRPCSINTASRRSPGSMLRIPPALPLSIEPSLKISSFLYKPAIQKVTPLARLTTIKNVYSPRRLGTAAAAATAAERACPSDTIELFSGLDAALMEPQSVQGVSQVILETSAPSLIVTSASSAHPPGINNNWHSFGLHGNSPNASHRNIKQTASPYASPRSPSALHDAHSPRHPVSRIVSPQHIKSPVSSVPVEPTTNTLALHNPHNYAAYPVTYYAAQADTIQPTDTSADEAHVREFVAPLAAPVPHSHAPQSSEQPSDTIWASSQQPMYCLRRPVRPASSRASKRSPNGSLCGGSSLDSSGMSGRRYSDKSTNNSLAGNSTTTLAHRTVATHRSVDEADNNTAEITTAGVLQSRPLHGVHTSPQTDQSPTQFAMKTRKSNQNSPKEKIIIPRLNIGDPPASDGTASQNHPSKYTKNAKPNSIIFTPGLPVYADHNNAAVNKKGFAPSPVRRATHNHDLLLSPAHKQRINLSQMVHTVDRIVSDPQYSPPIQPLPLLPNYNTGTFNNTSAHSPMNTHYSQLPRRERYDIYVDFSQSHGTADATHNKNNKVYAHNVVMPSVTVDVNFDQHETKSAEDSP